MAERTVMRLLIAALILAGASGIGRAQEAGPQDLTRNTADPVDRLVGLWRVDKIDGTAPSGVAAGQVLRVDRQSVATLTLGTCSNPGFAEALGAITVTCLGQNLASAAWNPEQPGSLRWSEGGFQAELSRISGTEALDSPPPAEDAAPDEGQTPPDEGGDEGTEDAQ